MSPKKKALIIIAVILVIVLLILLVWFLLNKKPVSETVVVVPETTQVVSRKETNDKVTPTVPEAPAIEQNGLESLAKTFAERYGSYSSESDFANLYDVLGLMSSLLSQKTQEFIAGAKVSGEYYGVTTRVLSVKIVSLDEEAGLAGLEVNTQREESKGGPENSEVKYQKLVLDYVMEGEVWKVNAANWQ